MDVGTLAPSPGLRKALKRANLWAYLFIVPALAFYVNFGLRPLFGSLILSFYRWDGVNPIKKFIGFGNYAEIFKDPIALLVFRNTVLWIVMSYAFQISVALFSAVLIAKIARGKTFFRVTLFLPKILSVAIVGVIWSRIYDPFIGIFNIFLRAIGLGGIARGWLGDPVWVLPAVNIANAWNGYPFYMILYIAGLQSIDPNLYEAAMIDGANAWQQFWNVTLPGIRDINTLVLSLSLINSLRMFDTVWVMTQGGPFYRSEVLATHIYKSAFAADKVGYGAAMSIILGVLIIALTIIFMRLREKGELE
ncbi:MAG: carbohydrate ABC transporter permease [bacterium]